MAASRIAAVVLASVSLMATAVSAQAPDAATGDKARREAVAKGLAFLSDAWRGDVREGPKVGGGTAIASLSGIAFLQSGSTTDGGPYQREVNKCLELVLASAQGSGLLAADATQGPMYGHGFGMLFLSEAYARAKDDAVKKRILPVLGKAVALSEKSQNEEGGWRYQPVPYDADVSVTVGQLNGLLAAKAAGVRVSDDVRKKAGDYVVSCQNPDGGFSYMAHGRGNSGLPRSAAALSALQHADAATREQRDKAVAFVAKFAKPDADAWANGHAFYGQYYLAQALLAAGGEHRTKTSAAFRDLLLKRQQDDGSWTGDIDKTYDTSMALIALQMPDRWLTVLAPRKAQ